MFYQDVLFALVYVSVQVLTSCHAHECKHVARIRWPTSKVSILHLQTEATRYIYSTSGLLRQANADIQVLTLCVATS